MPEFALRPAKPDDHNFLRELFASTRESELAALPPQFATTFIDQQFAAQSAHYTEKFSNADHHILMVAGAPAGRILVDRGAEQIHLIDISIITTHRGQGLGTAILSELCDEADRTGRPIRLSVFSESPAKDLYKRLGFRVHGAEETYSAMLRQPTGRV